jgi:flagellar motor switch protein FliM
MTHARCAHLAHTNIRQLLASVGSGRVRNDSPVEATKRDWRSPHYFSEDQYNRLAAVMSQVAAAIGARLTHFFCCDLEVAPSSILQRFAGSLGDLGIDEKARCVTFGPVKDKPCGFLSLSAETARRWVTRLLGDSESDADANRPFSSLEESLLVDLATAALDAFLSPLLAHQDLRPGDGILKGDPGIELDPTQEVCAVTFTVRDSSSSEGDRMLFVTPCSVLAPLVGKVQQTVRQSVPEEMSRTLMEHVQQMPVKVIARLGSTKLSFADVVELGRNDILLLDRSPHESIELLLGDRVIVRGRPVKAGGKRAVLVTELAGVASPKTSKAATTG